MEKARRLASEMNIFDDDFKATWGWFRKFRHRQCLNTINLYGEGGAVDRNDPELLVLWKDLQIIFLLIILLFSKCLLQISIWFDVCTYIFIECKIFIWESILFCSKKENGCASFESEGEWFRDCSRKHKTFLDTSTPPLFFKYPIAIRSVIHSRKSSNFFTQTSIHSRKSSNFFTQTSIHRR